MPKYDLVQFAREQVKAKYFGVNRICQLCGISKATYYYVQHPDDRFLEKYNAIKRRLEKVIEQNPAYGVKRLKAALWQQYKIFIGRDALSRLLKLWGLNLKRKIRKSKPNAIKIILAKLSARANLLASIIINKPFQAITSDISELLYNYGHNTAYLCAHKDIFGQMVYGYCLRQTMDVKLVLISLSKAARTIKKLSRRLPRQRPSRVSPGLPKNILWHQDQGSQYTGYQYVEAILKIGRLSFSEVGTPTDNPGQESFFGRFKDEWADEVREIKDFKELQKFIQKKIHYYNYRRLHNSTGLTTPYQFTKNFLIY